MRSEAATLLLWACGGFPTAEDYAAGRASAECGRIQRCELGFFEAEYSSAEDCVNERTDDIDNENNDLDDAECRFDSAESGACVGRIRRMSCEEWHQGRSSLACDLVWDCTQELR